MRAGSLRDWVWAGKVFGKFEGIGVESAWVWALQSSWVRVLKVRGKFEGVWAWKVRGKFEGVWAWKVHAESLRG